MVRKALNFLVVSTILLTAHPFLLAQVLEKKRESGSCGAFRASAAGGA